MNALRGGALWWVWFRWVTAGEFAGFAVPAAAGTAVAAAPARFQVPALLAAGAAEGAILGFAQSRVLRRALPAVSPSRWISVTVLGALVAWFAGTVPLYAWPLTGRVPGPVQAAGALLLGAVLLLSIGVAQWTVLRRLVDRAGWWVAATAAAWTAGLAAFTAVSTPLWRPGQPWQVVAAVGMLAGAVMAATMAALTGWTLVRLVRPVPESSSGSTVGLPAAGRTTLGGFRRPRGP